MDRTMEHNTKPRITFSVGLQYIVKMTFKTRVGENIFKSYT